MNAMSHPASGSAPRPVVDRLLAGAGLAGPVLFTAAFLVQEGFRRGEYSALAETVSGLEAGPGGWVQQLNFVVFGLHTLAFAVGLHRGLRPTRLGALGPALLFTSGIGLVLAAIFPLREDALGRTFDPGGHIIAGITFFLGAALGLIVVSRRLARDPRWRGLAGYALAAGIVAVTGFVAGGRLAMPEAAPLHEWAGLWQRGLLLVVLPCWVALALRLLRLARTEPAAA